MGYYLTKHLIGSADMYLVGVKFTVGFCVLKPKRYEALMAELKRTSEYQNLCQKLFQYGRELESSSYYQHGTFTLKEAKSRFYRELVMEELEYNFIQRNFETEDFDFLLSESRLATNLPSVAKLVFECFLEDSKSFGVEVMAGSTRFFRQLSGFGRLFSSQRTGDTIFSILTSDIKDMHICREGIEIMLKDASSFALWRDCYKTPSDTKWQYLNGTSAM